MSLDNDIININKIIFNKNRQISIKILNNSLNLICVEFFWKDKNFKIKNGNNNKLLMISYILASLSLKHESKRTTSFSTKVYSSQSNWLRVQLTRPLFQTVITSPSSSTTSTTAGTSKG